MPSILYRGVRSMTRRVWNFVNPRAIAWRHIEKRCPDKPIITKLGRDLKVRIYKNDVIGKYIYVDGMFEKTEAMFVTRFLKPGRAATCLSARRRRGCWRPSATSTPGVRR